MLPLVDSRLAARGSGLGPTPPSLTPEGDASMATVTNTPTAASSLGALLAAILLGSMPLVALIVSASL